MEKSREISHLFRRESNRTAEAGVGVQEALIIHGRIGGLIIDAVVTWCPAWTVYKRNKHYLDLILQFSCASQEWVWRFRLQSFASQIMLTWFIYDQDGYWLTSAGFWLYHSFWYALVYLQLFHVQGVVRPRCYISRVIVSVPFHKSMIRELWYTTA